MPPRCWFCCPLRLPLAKPRKSSRRSRHPRPPATPAAPSSTSDAQAPNRAVAYYHLALANIYEDEALENGNVDASRLAVEEYKIRTQRRPDFAAVERRAG